MVIVPAPTGLTGSPVRYMKHMCAGSIAPHSARQNPEGSLRHRVREERPAAPSPNRILDRDRASLLNFVVVSLATTSTDRADPAFSRSVPSSSAINPPLQAPFTSKGRHAAQPQSGGNGGERRAEQVVGCESCANNAVGSEKELSRVPPGRLRWPGYRSSPQWRRAGLRIRTDFRFTCPAVQTRWIEPRWSARVRVSQWPRTQVRRCRAQGPSHGCRNSPVPQCARR